MLEILRYYRADVEYTIMRFGYVIFHLACAARLGLAWLGLLLPCCLHSAQNEVKGMLVWQSSVIPPFTDMHTRKRTVFYAGVKQVY